MAYTFKDLQDEVSRRATRDQSGTQFTAAIKNVINTSIFRISREAPWRSMRRKDEEAITTKTAYTTGSGAVTATKSSKAVSVVGATFLTDNIEVGRRINISGDGRSHRIATITSETALTLERNYTGTSTTTGTYSILGQEQYNLPAQCTHRLFLWHEEYGYPTMLRYVTDQEFYGNSTSNSTTGVPLWYRMWGEDSIREQLRAASVATVSSSSTADTNIGITVYGEVSGFPDFETINTDASDGTTATAGSKSFTRIDRVVKDASTTGRITVTANSANTTVATIPVGDRAAGIVYRKIQLYPLPNTAFPIKAQWYEDPTRLTQDADVHNLGADFDEAIILLATSKVKLEESQQEGSAFMVLYQDEVKNLKKTNVDKIDWFPTLFPASASHSPSRHLVAPNLAFSQAGANFGPRSRI